MKNYSELIDEYMELKDEIVDYTDEFHDDMLWDIQGYCEWLDEEEDDLDTKSLLKQLEAVRLLLKAIQSLEYVHS